MLLKHFLSLITFLFFIITAHAQKLYTIGFEDTDDERIGTGCSLDKINIQKYFKRIGNDLGYEQVNSDFSGDDFTEANFKSFVSSLETDPNDIIIFYVSSHGARSDRDESMFPQVYLKGRMQSVYKKYLELQKLPHKALITIIDACNVIRGISPKEIQLFNKTYEPDNITANVDLEKANVKKLLLTKGFDLLITSSQVGVTSLSTSQGSVFTNCFIEAFNYYITSQNSEYVSIDNILVRAKQYTLNESQRIYINSNSKITLEEQPHYPIWKLNRAEEMVVSKDISLQEFNLNYSVKKLTLLEKLRYRTNNDYIIDVEVKGSPESMKKISKVTYYLHHSFPQPIVEATDKEHSYKYRLFSYGEFLLRSEVVLEDGSEVDLAKYLKFDTQGNKSK